MGNPGKGGGRHVRGTVATAGAVRGLRRLSSLLANAELPDELRVPVGVLALQVVEQPAPLADQLQQAAPRMVILDVGLEVFGQVADAFAEKGDLDFRGAGVGVVRAVDCR